MKKISILACLLAFPLAACGSSSSANVTPAGTTSESSSSLPSEVSYDLDLLKDRYGEFRIDDGSYGSHVYDADSHTYYLNVNETNKAEYTLSGYFEGHIIIQSTFASYKGVTLTLSSACIVGYDSSPTLFYAANEKNVCIKAKKDTHNAIINVGNGIAIYSNNNVEFCGKGSLELATLGGESHTVRAGKKITFYSSPNILVRKSDHDAFHGNQLNFVEESDATNLFTGTLTIQNVSHQAFDFETSSGKGYIHVQSGNIFVQRALNVFKTDAELTIDAPAVIQATEISGDPYAQGDNSSGIMVTINGTFTVDGKAVTE